MSNGFNARQDMCIAKSLAASISIYDTQSHHRDIPEIMRLAQLNIVSGADTPLMQMAALAYWQEHRHALMAATQESQEKTRARQFASVRALVDYAFTYVPFYRELYGSVGFGVGAIQNWSDFEALPIISKQTIAHLDQTEMLAEGAENIEKFSSRSSGSSGVPLTIWLDRSDVIRDFAEQVRFLLQATQGALLSSDWIYTLHHGGFWYSSVLGQYRVFRLMDLKNIDALALHWGKLRPRVVTTLPSYFPALASLGSLRQFGISAVISNSEMSSPEERARYSKIFGVPVRDEYSSEEIGFIATECSEGSYHLVEDGVYAEILNADADHVGRVVVTDLGNILMPLIRYDHGDLARESNCLCPCGQTFRQLSALHGRCDDAFMKSDGRYLPTASVLAICDDLLTNESSGMSAYRLIQTTASEIELHYTNISSHCANTGVVIAEAQRRLSELFGYGVQIDPHVHRELPLSASYKRRTLMRAWGTER